MMECFVPSFMREQCYLSVRDNTGMLTRCLRSVPLGRDEKPHLFLCVAVVFELSARHCEFAPKTHAFAFNLCQPKGYGNNFQCFTLLYQEIDELLPKPKGVHVFSSSCQEEKRSEDDLLFRMGQSSHPSGFFDWCKDAQHTLVAH